MESERGETALGGGETLAGDGEASGPIVVDDAPLLPGDAVGRYQIIERLGQGGMGLVYRAHDGELDRDVAIKIGRALPGASRARERRKGRLRREARNLARVEHPHIVRVLDVGLFADRVFVAMELVEGQTLGQWLDQATQSWRERLAVLLAAGEGLAAAHDVGLVHRDFKPDNVIVGSARGRSRPADRVRVVDFGLATVEAEIDASAPEGEISGPGIAGTLTRDTRLTGTPAYMSPEQFLRTQIDPRSDLFSFCVVVFEALYGRRPFEGATLAELAFEVTQGNVQWPASGPRIPRVVRSAIAAGLSADPDERPADMRTLLAQLRRGLRPRWHATTALVSVVGAVGVLGWTLTPRSDAPPLCAPTEAGLGDVWSADRARTLASRFASAWPDRGAATWSEVRPRLDTYATQWLQVRRDVCNGDAPDERQPALTCLRSRRVRFAALLDVLEASDETAVRRSPLAIATLPSVEGCLEVRSDGQRNDAELPAKLAALGSRLAHAQALHAAGKTTDALAAAEPVLDEARAAKASGIVAEAAWLVAQLLEARGDYDRSVALVEEAFVLAGDDGNDALARRCAVHLMTVDALQRSRFDDAHRWQRQASALLERGPDDPVVRGHFEYASGVLAQHEGRTDEALAHFERAHTIYEETLGSHSSELAQVLNARGVVLQGRGQLDEAQDAFERSMRINVALHGDEDPAVAFNLLNLGTVLGAKGDAAAAAEHFRRAVESFERSRGPDHPEVGSALTNLGIALTELGQLDEAVAAHRRAAAITATAFGEDHMRYGQDLGQLATTLARAGQWDEADTAYVRAISTLERAMGDENPALAVVLANYADALLDRDRPKDAHRHATRGLEIAASVLGKDHPLTTELTRTLARAELNTGDTSAALTHLRPAVAQSTTLPRDHPARAELQAELGQALFAHAKHLATTDNPDELDETLTELREWLQTRPPGESEPIRTWLAAHDRR